MMLNRLPAFEYTPRPKSLDHSYSCLCCNDTGLVVETWELRDESHDCLAQMLPPMHCKGCNALRDSFLDGQITDKNSGEKRYLYPHEINARINDRYDTRASKAQCQELHERAARDYRTRGQPSKVSLVEKVKQLSEGTEF